MVANKSQEIYRQARTVTIVGSALDACLGLLKVVVGWWGHSNALVTDGFHSLSDLATDLVVLWIMRLSLQDADEDHPYGHKKFEAIGTGIIGASLIFLAGVLAAENVRDWWVGDIREVPSWATVVVAGFSFIAKEIIFWYSHRVGKAIDSPLLVANAWHSRSDAFTSLVVVIGLLGAKAGWLWLDYVVAIGLAIWLAKIGWQFALSSLRELVDTSALGTDELQEITTIIRRVDGVVGVHDLRTRWMGGDIFVDVHVEVMPHISVSEGHQIGVFAVQRIKQRFPSIQDVVFHVDPEADTAEAVAQYHALLPLRTEVLAQLQQVWSQCSVVPESEKVILHYTDEGIKVEWFISAGLEEMQITKEQRRNIYRELIRHAHQLPWLLQLNFWYGTNNIAGKQEKNR